MSISLVSQNDASAVSAAPTVTLSVTSGNLLVLLGVGRNGTGTHNSVTDGQGQTWTQVGTPVNASGYASMWHCQNTFTGSLTVTLNLSASDTCYLNLSEWSGQHATTPYTGSTDTKTNTATTTHAHGATGISATSGQLLIGVAIQASTVSDESYTGTNVFTALQMTNSTNLRQWWGYRIAAGSETSVTGDWTQTSGTSAARMALFDLASGPTPVTGTESLPSQVSETSSVSSSVLAGESIPAGLSEGAVALVTFSVSDSLAVIVDEPGTMSQEITALSDDLSINLTEESGTIIALVNVSDDLAMGMIETSTLSTNAISVDVTDSLQAGLSEAATVAAFVSVSDDLPIGVTDAMVSSSLKVSVADSLTVIIEEPTTNNQEITPVEETVSATIDETSTVFSSVFASDSLVSGVSEISTLDDITSLISAKASAENITAGLSEETITVVYLATSDSITATVSDDIQTLIVSLATSEELPAGYAENALNVVALAASDSAEVIVSELLDVFNALLAEDPLAVISVESATTALSGEYAKTAGDSVSMSITENAVVVSREVGTISVIKATVQYIGPIRTVETVSIGG